MLTPWQSKLLASAHLASAAVSDMTDAVRDGEISPFDNVGSGDTLHLLVDAVRLLMEATVEDDQDTDGQLYAAVAKWISDTTGIEPPDGEAMP